MVGLLKYICVSFLFLLHLGLECSCLVSELVYDRIFLQPSGVVPKRLVLPRMRVFGSRGPFVFSIRPFQFRAPPVHNKVLIPTIPPWSCRSRTSSVTWEFVLVTLYCKEACNPNKFPVLVLIHQLNCRSFSPRYLLWPWFSSNDPV